MTQEQLQEQQPQQQSLNNRLLSAMFDPNTPVGALRDVFTEIQMVQIFAQQMHGERDELIKQLADIRGQVDELRKQIRLAQDEEMDVIFPDAEARTLDQFADLQALTKDDVTG